jgi:uncharacterized protein (TIGR03067 family)
MIRFPCPRCDAALKAPDDRAGQKVTCPKCERAVPVPEPEDVPPAELDDENPPRKFPAWAWGAIAAGILVLVVSIVLIVGWSGRNSGDANRPAPEVEIERLQGRWKIVSTVIDGTPAEELVPPEKRHMLDQSYIAFEGNNLRTIFPNKSDRAAVLLNPGASPKQITLTWEANFADGNVDDGIYELRGDQLKICFSPRSKKSRPTSFSVNRGDKHVNLWVLRREK